MGHEGDFALAWTSDGIGWLAYVVTRYDEEVQYMAQPGAQQMCLEVIRFVDASRVLHVARVPFDGSPSRDVLTLPIASTSGVPGYYSSNQSGLQLKTARLFDARAFGTDLAIGFQTNDSSGIGTIRVLRIDTTRVPSPN